ncbi:hypothetical protein [Nonomuraea sp. KM90]|uniref:hypothetical protein n=1 Tax=Nonomuraea sp. KM90 TaxID=3457428 RepID=UPI003FCD0544
MADAVAEKAEADAEYLRTVLPVAADYVRQLADGVDFDRLKRIAQQARAAHALPLISALIAACEAVKQADKAPVPESFTVITVGLCVATVCTSVTNDEATGRLNVAHPTGISTRWELAGDPFPNGDPNPSPCRDHPDTHRHLLFHC